MRVAGYPILDSVDRSQEFIAIAREMHKESGTYAPFEFNEVGTQWIYEAIQLEQYIGYMLVDHNVEKVIGFIVGYIQAVPFCHATFAYEMLLYLTPDHRNFRNVRALVQMFEEHGKRENVDRIMLSSTSDYETDGIEKLHQRLGYRTIGTVAVKEWSN